MNYFYQLFQTQLFVGDNQIRGKYLNKQTNKQRIIPYQQVCIQIVWKIGIQY